MQQINVNRAKTIALIVFQVLGEATAKNILQQVETKLLQEVLQKHQPMKNSDKQKEKKMIALANHSLHQSSEFNHIAVSKLQNIKTHC